MGRGGAIGRPYDAPGEAIGGDGAGDGEQPPRTGEKRSRTDDGDGAGAGEQ